MDPDVLVQESGIVECDALKTLEVGRELVQLGEPPTTLLFNANLDVANPAALQLYALGDDFFLETTAESVNPQRQKAPMISHRSLMISL